MRGGWGALAAAALAATVLTAVPTQSGAAASAPGVESTRRTPVVSELTVTQGPVTGGTRVVVRGRHLASARKVLFGKVRGTVLEVRSGRRVVVSTPAHAAGTFPVRVVTRGGRSEPGPTFTFVATQVPPADPPSTSRLSKVECPADGACVALGSHEPSDGSVALPVVHTRVAGTWAVSVPPLPDGAATTGARLTGLSCASATSCVAVGNTGGVNGTPFAEVWDGGTWTLTSIPLPAEVAAVTAPSVSCATAQWCVAVADASSGGRAVSSVWNGSGWSSTLLPLPSGAEAIRYVVDIDCPDAGWCAAVAMYLDAEPGGPPYRGTFVLRYAEGAWGVAPGSVAPTTVQVGTFSVPRGLVRIACPVAGRCVATGSAEPLYVLADDDGGYTEDALPYSGGLADVVCLTEDLPCRTAGSTRTDYFDTTGGPYLATVSAAGPVVAEVPMPGGNSAGDPDNPRATVVAMACVSETRCLAVGSHWVADPGAAFGQRELGLLVQTSPTNGYTSVPGPAGADGALFSDVAVLDASHALVVGEYVDGVTGESRALRVVVPLP